MDAKLKHLELIQGVVNRLASNSFQMKGWAVVLVSATLVFVAREGRIDLAAVGFVPVVIFWGLDGYVLWQERLFRGLYDIVRILSEDEIDFSMDISVVTPDRSLTWLGTVFSKGLLPFYGALAVAVGVAAGIG